MITDKHLKQIAEKISEAVKEKASLQNSILNYSIRKIENAFVLEFTQEPDLKDLFLGQPSQAQVEGKIEFSYWIGEEKNGWGNKIVSFWTQEIDITYDKVDDLFIIDYNFDFYPQRLNY